MTRKFAIQNSLGDICDLTTKNKNQFSAFFNEPKGLGFKKSVKAIRVGDSEIISSDTTDIPAPSGEIVFYNPNTAYENYLNFINFLVHTPVRLLYTPANTTVPYYIDCRVTEVGKEEINHDDGSLRCPITFYGTSLWMSSQENQVTFTNNVVSGEDGKFYNLVRPYNYSGMELSDIEFYNNGQLDCGFKMEIIGDIQNPVLSAYDTMNDKYGAVGITGTYDYVKFSTEDNDQSIYLEREGVSISNPSSYLDLSIRQASSPNAIIPFFKIKPGRSKLVFSAGDISMFDGELVISWNTKYLSV